MNETNGIIKFLDFTNDGLHTYARYFIPNQDRSDGSGVVTDQLWNYWKP
jgi:hypothetical protein